MEGITREIYGNIDGISKAVFYVLAIIAMAVFLWGTWKRVRIWRIWQNETKTSWNKIGRRIWAKALRQKKVVQGPRKWGAGLAHAALFFGFMVLFVGTCLVAVEEYSQLIGGRVATDPVFHKGIYFVIYELTLDIGGLGLIAGCAYFIWRRLRATSSMEHRFADWVVVGSLLYLGLSGYLIEGCRILLEDTQHAWISPVGYCFARALNGLGYDAESIAGLHKINWWVHAVVALGFIAAIPYCRLLHIVAGTFNIALRDYEMGRLDPVSIEDLEKKGYVGTGGTTDLAGLQRLALDACVSCGRCQDACPAYAAGKPLSPRDLIQDIRRQAEKADAGIAETDPGDLHGDIISGETLWACTTCHACVDACPVEVAPLEFITDMRRYLVGEGSLRGTAAVALQKVQRTGNPWGMPAQDRFDWADGLGVPTVKDNPQFEVLYWVGCAASYDPRIRKVARATVQLLQVAGVNFACLGPEERCTGDSARRLGDEFLFQELAERNVETLNRYGVNRIVTHCPHCLNSLNKDYSQFGGDYQIQHHSQYLQELLESGALKLEGEKLEGKLTYHDPCYLARVNNVTEAPRSVLGEILQEGSNSLVEMKRSGCGTGCCGAGGGRMWFDDKAGERAGQDRIAEVQSTGVETVAVACPFCMTMMQDGLAMAGSNVQVKDISELMADALQQ